MIEHNEVLGALSGVRDPELDEPITDLEFVSGLEIEGDAVSVRLRLPTYFCAPNFSYLMVADAKEAVLSVPGVKKARVVLDDHYASEEINAGVNEEQGFDGAFEGETEGPDLEDLRTTFRRKSFVSRQEGLCRTLLSEGRSPKGLARMTLGDVPPSGAFETYLDRRAELGLDVSAGAPLIVDPDGKRVPEEAVVEHLRFARLTRVSIEGNAGLCRGLLETRYGTPGVREKEETHASRTATPLR
jgi:metal-sulfur cluster biosynthetic enzyme